MRKDLVDLMEDNRRFIGKTRGPRLMDLKPDTSGTIDEDPEELTPADVVEEEICG